MCDENGKITEKDIYMENLHIAVEGDKATFDMLRDILAKFFPTLFYLNGGAAIAILAFIGNFIKYDDKYLIGMLNALSFFAGGAMLTTAALGASYFAQCRFKNFGDESVHRALQGICIKNQTKAQKNNLNHGERWRRVAIVLSVGAGMCFALGGIIFVGAFRGWGI